MTLEEAKHRIIYKIRQDNYSGKCSTPMNPLCDYIIDANILLGLSPGNPIVSKEIIIKAAQNL